MRYADDFVVLGRSEAEAGEALQQVPQWPALANLKLHPVKTRIVDATPAGGFDFLGYHFERGYRCRRPKRLKKFKDPIWGQDAASPRAELGRHRHGPEPDVARLVRLL